MAIQMRRGAYSDFAPSSLLPGEWAIVLSDDPDAVDGHAAYICFAAGDVQRLSTQEGMVEAITEATETIIADLTAGIEEAEESAVTATAAATAAAEAAEEATEAATTATEEAEVAAAAALSAVTNSASYYIGYDDADALGREYLTFYDTTED